MAELQKESRSQDFLKRIQRNTDVTSVGSGDICQEIVLK